MEQYLYVNSQFKNSSNVLSSAISRENRGGAIIPSSLSGWKLSVDRWFIHMCYLPLFKVQAGLSITIEAGVNSSSQTLIFPTADSDGFIYDYQDFVDAVNVALESACVDLGIAEIPVMSYDRASTLFIITNDVSFRNNYDLYFSMNLGTMLSTFPVQLESNRWKVVLSSDEVKQSSTTVDFLSPVARITIESDVPIVPELLPSNLVGTVSKNLSTIVSDYRYTQQNSTAVQSMLYTADGNHRWQTMIDDNTFNRFQLSYHWVDYDNNKYDLRVLPMGTTESKLVFMKK